MIHKAVFFFAALFALALAAANIVLGTLNLDEGWYLYSAISVSHGLAPYRDFFFTQAPMLPKVYALFAPLWSPHGVLGGRVLTAVIGLAAALVAALAVRDAVPRNRRAAASATLFLLLAGNIYHSYFTVIPKTYALASLFIAAALFFLAKIPRYGLRGKNAYALAAFGGFWFAAAAATRLSLGIALAIAGFYFLVRCRRYGLCWLFFGIGGLLGLGLLLVPAALADIEAFKFANFFHGARSAGGIVLLAGSVSRLARNYMPLCLLLLAFAGCGFFGGFKRATAEGLSDTLLTLLVFAGIFAVHVLSPFPYDDYQVPGMPLLAFAVTALFWRVLPVCADESREIKAQNILLPLFLLIAVLFAGTSPLNESWVMVRKDRFWVQMKEKPDILKLREVGREIAASVPADKPLLTQDTYLAVEAGRSVPPGFEMGPFGFFPALTDEESARFHVINKSLAEKTFAECGAPIAAFSGYSFAMAAPAMDKIDEMERNMLFQSLAEGYEKIDEVADFGQEFTTLAIWKKK